MIRSGCLLCSSPLIAVPYPHVGITSDCKPWPRAGQWVVCSRCGHVQKHLDDEWYSDIESIYRNYEMYPLSDGMEQVVFRESAAMPRTLCLMSNIRQEVTIKERGSLLDIGCGNGSFLRTFNELYPQWDLFGYEQSDINREHVTKLPCVRDFFSGELDEIRHSFDIITLLYVIEHLTDPVSVLKTVRNLLKPDGLLIIQTSYYRENPFDLIVVDHCSHFTTETLTRLVETSGFHAIFNSDRWMPKEISVIGEISGDGSPSRYCEENVENIVAGVRNMLVWLDDVSSEVKAVAKEKRVGVFGTAIAGSWLANEAGDCVQFFVDEDTSRQGKHHNGLRVVSPTEVSQDSVVYLAFPPRTADTIYARLRVSYPSLNVVCPRSQYEDCCGKSH